MPSTNRAHLNPPTRKAAPAHLNDSLPDFMGSLFSLGKHFSDRLERLGLT